LALMWHCMLRPSELCALDWESLRLPKFVNLFQKKGVVVIRSPKTARKGPLYQHVLIESQWLLQKLEAWFEARPMSGRLFPSYAVLRKLLARYINSLGLRTTYTLGGLRGGGASFRYLCNEEISRIQRRGRWQSAKSLDHYLQPATTFLSTQHWSSTSRSLILQLAQAPAVEPFLAELSAGT
jgi:integrase